LAVLHFNFSWKSDKLLSSTAAGAAVLWPITRLARIQPNGHASRIKFSSAVRRLSAARRVVWPAGWFYFAKRMQREAIVFVVEVALFNMLFVANSVVRGCTARA